MLSPTPRVSIVLPTFNRAYCLARTIDSLLAQTFSDFELIVVDDGSSDGTKACVAAYTDSRIRYMPMAVNIGKSAAANAGARAALGEWLMFADSDDRSRPERLALQLKCAEGRSLVDGVFARTVFVDDNEQPTTHFFPLWNETSAGPSG